MTRKSHKDQTTTPASARAAGYRENTAGAPASGDGQSAQSGPPDAESQAAAVSEEEPARLQARLEALEQEVVEKRDAFLRAKAETENVRRRAENDVASARKFGIERFATELLPVKDSLELARALEIRVDDTDALEKMREGLDLTLKLLEGVFGKFAIAPVDPKPGEKLDPSRHQAMSTQESSEIPANHVVTCVQRGYMLHDRLLRPAMVIVAREAAGQGGSSS